MNTNKKEQKPIFARLTIDGKYHDDGGGNLISDSGEIGGFVDYENGTVKLLSEAILPINPATNKPYFKVNPDAFGGDWRTQPPIPIGTDS